MLSSAALEALAAARHDDPFGVLGMHECDGALVVRAVLPEATEIALAKVTAPAPFRVALAAPVLSPMVIVPVPKEPATLPLAVPALIVNPLV